MYNEQLEKLIEMALMDGELTENEKQILFKKAESFSIDLNEFEMVIEARLFEKKNAKNKEVTDLSGTNKSEKFGDLKKCPSCGARVQSFNTSCAECGHEFRGIEASKTISKLFEQLDKIEKERDTIKLGGLSGLLGGLNEASKQMQIDEIITRKKAALIRNFPIQNTREELLELLHFIHPKINNKASSDNNFNDWKARFHEIIGRAKFAYKNDKSMLAELQLYENTAKGTFFSYFNQLDKIKKTRFIVLIFSILFFGFLISLFSGMSSNHDKGVEKEKARLELIMNKVNDANSKKDYESALMLCAQLKWEYSDSYSSTDTKELTKAWDEKREKLIEVIKNEKQTNIKLKQQQNENTNNISTEIIQSDSSNIKVRDSLFSPKNEIASEAYSAKVMVDKTFFYQSPDLNSITKAYIIKGQEVRVSKEIGDFIYVAFDNNGKIKEGWMLKNDF